MTLRVKVRQGGASDSTTTDFSGGDLSLPHIPIFYGYEFSAGMQFGQMTANQSTFTIVDPTNLIRTTGSYQVNAHNVVWMTEDGPGWEAWLHRGRVARKDFGRGIYKAHVARTVTVVSEDGNVDLRGLALVEPWVRPAETGTERVIEAIEAFCQGDPRLTTDITASRDHLIVPHPVDGEVTMPAKTYPAGTEVTDIIRDCAETEGQEVGVVIHHTAPEGSEDGESHLCLLWCEEDDWEAYPCLLSISDDDTEVDGETVFTPHWRQGSALQEDGQEVLSGIVSRYGTGDDSYVVHHVTENADKNDYWVEQVQDATSVTEAQATTRAGHLRAGRANEHRTTQVSLIIPASMAHLLCAGMSIDIKSAAARAEEGLGNTVTRRIASLKWEPKSPEGGDVEPMYWAHMQLDRPKKIARTRREPVGPKPPSAGGPASCSLGVDQMTAIATPNGDFETGNREHWHDGAGVAAQPVVGGGGQGDYMQSTGVIGGGGMEYLGWQGEYTFVAGTTYVFRVWASSGTGGAIRVGVSGDYAGYYGSDYDDDTTGLDPLPGGSFLAGFYCVEWTPSSSTDQATFLHAKSNTGTLATDSLTAYTGTGGSQPGEVDEEGDIGDETGEFANAVHSHKHGNITAGGPYHMAEDVTVAPFSTIAATNVQAALEELLSEATGGSDDQTAAEVAFTPAGTIAATDVQAAVEEVATDAATALTGHTGDSSAAHAASAVSIADSGGYFTGTDVEAALQELGAGGGGGGTDEKAAVSANDTTPGYLNGKLVAGTGISLTEGSDGGDETLTIAATGGGGGSSGPFPLGMPYGTLDRTYTFDSDTESWTNSGGTLSQTSGRLQLNGSTNGVALEPDVGDIANGEVQLDYYLNGTGTRRGAIIFRADDTSNFYMLEVYARGGASPCFQLWKRVSGTYTSLESFAHTLLPWTGANGIRLMIRFVGNVVELYLNNTLYGQFTVDGTFSTGRVGIRIGSSFDLQIDNVQVYSITTETQASPGTGARA